MTAARAIDTWGCILKTSDRCLIDLRVFSPGRYTAHPCTWRHVFNWAVIFRESHRVKAAEDVFAWVYPTVWEEKGMPRYELRWPLQLVRSRVPPSAGGSA